MFAHGIGSATYCTLLFQIRFDRTNRFLHMGKYNFLSNLLGEAFPESESCLLFHLSVVIAVDLVLAQHFHSGLERHSLAT
jgi:hypothetical protein